jgi:mono/diheme cytochrome c family protein
MRSVLIVVALLFPLFQAHIVSAQGNPEAGKKLWESGDARCQSCHGLRGQGAYGPDLAGRQLSFEQFQRAVRKPWGIMPAFPENQYSDKELADFFAYFQSLPRVAEPGPWRTQVPANAPKGLEILIATFGCAQCHGAIMAAIRANAGAVAADFEWFKGMVYEHTTVMPEHRKLIGEAPDRVRMGNFSRTRVPESSLAEAWLYLKDDAKFRPHILSRLTAPTPAGAYNLLVQNAGLVGKGLTAEDITILLAVTSGTKVTNASGPGYQGVRNDPELKADVAVWQLPRLGPKQEQTYTLTVASGGGITRGLVRWAKPAQGAGRNAPIEVVMQRPPQTNQ